MASVPALARREADRLSGCGRNRTCTAEASDLQSGEPTTLLNAPVMSQSERRESNPFFWLGKPTRDHYATLAYQSYQSPREELNLQPSAYEAAAPPVVLLGHQRGAKESNPAAQLWRLS